MKKKILIALVVMAVLCSTIFVVRHFVWGNWSSNNINRYTELTKYVETLPKLEDLGSYRELEFKYFRKSELIFFSDAYTLKISYDKENYQKEKEQFLQNYIYETKILQDYGGYEKEPVFEMDTYRFRMLSYRDYPLQSYPHNMIFVGFSDEKNKIVVVYYFDSDLDYIDKSFPQFLKEDCGWE